MFILNNELHELNEIFMVSGYYNKLVKIGDWINADS